MATPYSQVYVRSRVPGKIKGKAPIKTISLYFDGLHESGKTTIFKQLCYASGFRFGKEEKRLIRFGMIKGLYHSLEGILNKLEQNNSPVLEQFKSEVTMIRTYVKKNVPSGYGQDYRRAEKMLIPDKIKKAAFTIWDQEDSKKAFQQCKEQGGELVIDSFRLLMNRLKENKNLYDTFGTKKFIPDDKVLVFTSNGPRYALDQNIYLECEQNSSLKTNAVAENQYYSRPDLRPQVVKLPLNILSKKDKENYISLQLKDPGKKKLPEFIGDNDCLVFTVDISAFDTLVSRSIGIKDTDPDYEKMSILKYSINMFKKAAKRGHIVACIFTHVDLFFEKYQKQKIPINVLGDFPDAPNWGDEQDDAIKIALGYLQDIFLRERHEAYGLLDGASANRKNDLFKVFCVNATDVSNVQGTLRALVEQFVGLNIPINSKKI